MKILTMKWVSIQRAEGPLVADFTDHVFEGPDAEAQGNAYLRQIAVTAPMNGGYDKTDVKICFSNGQEWTARFDVKHLSCDDNDTDLRKHVRDFLFYHVNPDRIPWIMAEPEPQRSRYIESIRKTVSQHYDDFAHLLAELEAV